MRYRKWLTALCAIGLLCLQTGLAQAAPENGWWWNPNQSGRGFSIEIQGNELFMAGYLYENDGRAAWLVSVGPMQNATTYQGRLLSFSNGQTLTGDYKAPGAPTDAGAVTLQFTDDTHGTLTWPGGAIPIERFRFSSAAAASFQPEKGWWWNEAESGRGFFIEVQGDQMFMAGYMYDANGNPLWYVSLGGMSSATTYQGDWLQFANGQTLTGPYKPPGAPAKAGTASLNFSAPGQASLTLSDNLQPTASKTIAIKPFLTKKPASTGTGVATAVGAPNGSAVSATIGAAGGSIGTPDGKMTLTVPAGALAANTLISIQPITNTAHGGLGAGYRLTPNGQTFAQPVVLKFSYTDADLGGSDPAILGAAFQTAAGFWQWLGTPTTDSAAKTMSISTTHFTDFSMVQGYVLRPLSATLKVNASLALQVVYCYPPPIASGDDLTPLGLSCNTPAAQSGLSPLLFVNEWSVNGSVGGNGTVGTVSGNGASATYNAPAKKPTPNTVAVSARVNVGTKGKILVVSNVTITDGGFSGTTSYKDEYNTASAEMTWIEVSRTNNIAMYTNTGTGTIAYHAVSADSTCSFPATSGSLVSSGILFVDFNNTPPTYHGAAVAGTWPVTTTCTYAHAPTTTFTVPVGLPVFGGTKGPEGVEAGGVVSVSPDGLMTIEGSDTDGVGGIFNWKFTSSP